MSSPIEYLTKEDVQELIALRRHFHQHPEPSLKEYQTSQKVAQLLKNWGIDYQKVGETGILATLKGKKEGNRCILLRADMDALEMDDLKKVPYASTVNGLHHACGHDGHTAALLIAAKILKQREDQFGGTILFAFQPAEEIGAGARLFVQAGHLESVDQVFGIHLNSEYPTGTVVLAEGARYASCDIFKIHIRGEASHAAKPHLGRDALLAASSMVVALQSIVSRHIDPLEPAVLSIGVLQAGTRYNVVASNAFIEGTVRALSKDTREKMLSLVQSIAKDIANNHQCSIEFSNYAAANVLFNHSEATKRAQKSARSVVGDQYVITQSPPTLGAEDFADFLEEVQGCFAYVGTRNPNNPDTHYPHHHELFDIDEGGLVVAASLHIQVALDFLGMP